MRFDAMQTQKIIIWDFNRTLYNPDTGTFIENAKETVRYGFESGYVNILFSKNITAHTPVDKILAMENFPMKNRALNLSNRIILSKRF